MEVLGVFQLLQEKLSDSAENLNLVSMKVYARGARMTRRRCQTFAI